MAPPSTPSTSDLHGGLQKLAAGGHEGGTAPSGFYKGENHVFTRDGGKYQMRCYIRANSIITFSIPRRGIFSPKLRKSQLKTKEWVGSKGLSAFVLLQVSSWSFGQLLTCSQIAVLHSLQWHSLSPATAFEFPCSACISQVTGLPPLPLASTNNEPLQRGHFTELTLKLPTRSKAGMTLEYWLNERILGRLLSCAVWDTYSKPQFFNL